MEEEIDRKKIKYVLYARKSTVDESRQVRSIPDQIKECQQLAKRLGLKIIDVVPESKSAKKSGQRTEFSKMIKDIKSGKYDGIIAWHPDRLARNLLEGGMIVDLIDNDILKDVQFVAHMFDKTANGLMSLGLAFVMSKQYSDNLSANVKRGVRSKFSKGLTQIPKHGYKNVNGEYKPDGKNFELICDAWKMRREGKSLEAIAEYLSKNGYSRVTKSTSKKILINKKILSDVFRDSCYYGLLVQKGQSIDLREIYNFKPAVSETGFQEVQELSRRRIHPYNLKRRMIFYPFRGLVKCSFCGKIMVIGPSKGNTKTYLNLRCDNKECLRKKKSIRSKEILAFLYDFFSKNLVLKEKDYEAYSQKLKSVNEDKRNELLLDLHSAEGSLKAIQRQMEDIALALPKLTHLAAKKINEEKLNELVGEKEDTEQEIRTLREQVNNPEADALSLEQFLNLSKNAATIIKSANPIVKDTICRLIFLNLTVDEEKVLSYQLKPPFDIMLKVRQVSIGRGERT